jgi:hypothetical protein
MVKFNSPNDSLPLIWDAYRMGKLCDAATALGDAAEGVSIGSHFWRTLSHRPVINLF